ncbi:hypothetical protein HDA32_003708 [Spinactinospora alkalitolerans]|uniref:Trypsin-co-occurring domain-containing protein n=1 Tax=Spinactinospora alkalitolerans TaxID=687207 RepID=A0A852TXB8_9ACTN|nr:CU044_2847 family protein [Spinactinospora alkalitolerans]NYE48588.1 hypothetical protein [Spinactinospora alkalitolerans]
MAELIRFTTEDGGEILVTAPEAEPGLVDAGAGAVISDATVTFEQALERVRHVSTAALRKLRKMPIGPDEITVQMGIVLSAEAGAIIAKSSVEGNLSIELTWRRPDPSDPETTENR